MGNTINTGPRREAKSIKRQNTLLEGSCKNYINGILATFDLFFDGTCVKTEIEKGGKGAPPKKETVT